MEEIKEQIEEPTETIQKAKKPRSQKQIESFAKARQTRLEKSKIKNEKIQEIKDTVKNTPLQKLNPPKEDEDDDEDVETIVVRKKTQPKKKKTVVIVEESESESEEEIVYKTAPSRTKKSSTKSKPVEAPLFFF